ncbi:Silent information regulator protein Sir2 (fragment) [Desulfamplus magnetovallimortis]|uniref:protein acetyllysine N-acetyltransferase n=1 Tax=Desulfamplus magnetovallimortis TaxID=1246637 RepID=A0A1W1H9E7_9BACT
MGKNVDGLHIRAGNSIDRTYQIHGNIEYMRCIAPCSEDIIPISQEMPIISREEKLPEKYWELLRCPVCGRQTRPHVLLWDESYNEHHYLFQSSLDVALKTDLLIIAGTTGATNLPNQIVSQVMAIGGTVIDINIERNIFSDMAERSRNGFFWKSTSGSAFPQIVEVLRAYQGILQH